MMSTGDTDAGVAAGSSEEVGLVESNLQQSRTPGFAGMGHDGGRSCSLCTWQQEGGGGNLDTGGADADAGQHQPGGNARSRPGISNSARPMAIMNFLRPEPARGSPG